MSQYLEFLRYFFSWFHEDKDDGLTERVLSVEMVSKNGEPDQEIEDEMGDQELQQEYEDQEVNY